MKVKLFYISTFLAVILFLINLKTHKHSNEDISYGLKKNKSSKKASKVKSKSIVSKNAIPLNPVKETVDSVPIVIDEVISEFKHKQIIWNEFLLDAFVHKLNLSQSTIDRYEKISNKYSKLFQQTQNYMIKAINVQEKEYYFKKTVETIDKYKKERDLILGKQNISLIKKDIIPEFNRIYSDKYSGIITDF